MSLFKSKLIFLFFLLIPVALRAQPLLSIYENNNYVNYQAQIYKTDSIFHTSIRPYLIPDLMQTMDYDSIMLSLTKDRMSQKKWTDIIFNRNLIQFDRGDFAFTIDPLFDFSYGFEPRVEGTTWTNTRGALVQGSVGEDFAFSTRFYENQAVFPGHISDYISRRSSVPGQGQARGLNDALDYGSAAGYISYTPGKYFNFQLGHGRHFFGDGYRSMLLSDHALYYPYFRITSTIWRFKYVNMWSQFNHPDNAVDPGHNAYPRKYGTFHYLSFVAGKRWTLSLFESIIWQAEDSTGTRGFDLNYLNPMIFYRPVEFTLSSPDNAFMGANLSFEPLSWMVLYGQFILDEFRWSELKAGNGWYGNKFAWQAGAKFIAPFNIQDLYLQVEYNAVKPYMYSHYLTTQNYSHYREPLAYSYGANTKEYIVLGRYNMGRLYLNAKYVHAVFGLDRAGENYGKNIFLNYRDYENEYGNYTGQGLETTMKQADVSLSYLVNPSTNMNIYAALSWRTERNTDWENAYLWVSFGFRTSLRSIYYDFY